MVAITPAAMNALDAIRPAGVGGEVKVFGLSESQIARRVKVIAKAAGLADWEFFSGDSGRGGWPAEWPRTARPPTRSSARAAGSRAAAWSDVTPVESPPVQRCGTCSHSAMTVCWRNHGGVRTVKMVKFMFEILSRPANASCSRPLSYREPAPESFTAAWRRYVLWT